MGSQVGTAEEQKESRSGGGNAADGSASERRIYKVYWSDDTANSIDMRNATGVPAYGATLTTYPTAGYALIVMEKNAKPMPARQSTWEVEVIYRIPSPNQMIPKNTTTGKWQILKTMTPYPTEVPIQFDSNNKPLVNILAEPIKPAPTKVVYDQLLTINFLTDVFNFAAINALQGSSNGSAITLNLGGSSQTFAVNTLKFNAWPMQETYDVDGNLIASASLQFIYRSETWLTSYPNLSFYHLAPGGSLNMGGTNNALTLDNSSQGLAEPCYLSSGGGVLTTGSLITAVTFNIVQTGSLALWTSLLSGIDGY